MPFVSRLQEKWAFANKKPWAKEWASKTPKSLPLKTKMNKKYIKNRLGLKGQLRPGDMLKKWSAMKDQADDRARGVKAGSKLDMARDKGRGVPLEKKYKKNWISSAIKHPGALHRELGVKQGQKIPKARLSAAAKKSGKEGKRARLAMTLSKFHKGKKKATK